MISFDKPHAEVACTIAFADFVDGDDSRMIELGRRFRFPAQALQMRASCPLTNANDLYGDCAVETFLPCTEYYALASATDFFQQLVIPKLFGHFRWGRSCFAMRLGVRIHAAMKVKKRSNLKPVSLWRPMPVVPCRSLTASG